MLQSLTDGEGNKERPKLHIKYCVSAFHGLNCPCGFLYIPQTFGEAKAFIAR